MRAIAALLVAGAALAAGPVWALPAAVARLQPEAVVGAAEVRLGDVAALEGDPALVARLREVRLGPAPAPGLGHYLTTDHVALRLRQHRIDPAAVRLAGAERVKVTRAVQTLSGEALVEAAVAAARERLDEVEGRGPYAFEPVARPPDLRVGTGAVELVARVQDPSPPYHFVAVSVAVMVDGDETQVVPVALRVARMVPVVVAAQPLAPRTPLALADFRLETRPSTSVPAGALSAIDRVADLELLRPLRPGEVVTERDLRPRMVVKRGDAVTLVLEGQGFRITTTGQAVEDAKRGDLVRVLNPSSKREVVGRVEGAGLVRVRP